MKTFLLRSQLFWVGILLVAINGCMTASEHAKELDSETEREMTVGVVQKEIRKGMSKADVAAVLGSPNIVSSDKEIETWIYDKVATEVSYSRDKAYTGIIALIIGGGRTEAGASSQTQKTLTVIVKFKEGVVDDFSYHSSKF